MINAIGGFIKVLINWMATFFQLLYNNAIYFFAAGIGFIMVTVSEGFDSGLDYLWEMAQEYMAAQYEVFKDNLQALSDWGANSFGIDIIAQWDTIWISVDQFAVWVNMLNAYIPIVQPFGMLMDWVVLAVGARFIRYVVGWIPTVEG